MKKVSRTKTKKEEQPPTAKEVLEEAVTYWQAGLNILPIAFGTKEPAPIAGKWEAWQEVREEESMVRSWFGTNVVYNIGIICGAVSGNLVVVDFDNKQIFDKAKKQSKFAEAMQGTLLVQTSKGMHVYFRTPAPIRGFKIATLSIDVKAEGGYVLAPPSIHPSGIQYKLAGKQRFDQGEKIKLLNEQDFKMWLIDALDGIEGFKASDMKEEIDVDVLLLGGTEEGGRNDAAIKIASFFRVKKKLMKEQAWEQLKLWNKKNVPPLAEAELKVTLNSAYDRDEPYKYRFKGGDTELFTPEIEKEATELLKRHELLEYIEKDALKDIIGYREQKITLFLLNLMEESTQIHGDTSTGKSHMTDRVFECFPLNSWFKITGLTDKSIRYLGQTIRHLYLAEWQAIGTGPNADRESSAAFDIKLVISEGKLEILVVERDEETKQLATRKISTSISNVVSTTTNVALPPELLNRIWEITTNNALTPEVVRFKFQQRSIPLKKRINAKKERTVLRCAIDIIEREAPKNFVIPYANTLISIFEKLWTEARASRDADKLMRFIEASAYLHYKNRPIIGEAEDRQIVCLPEDFYNAWSYGRDVIIGTFTGETRRYVEIKRKLKEMSTANKEIDAENLALWTHIDPSRATRWLNEFVHRKVVFLKTKARSGRKIYELVDEHSNETSVTFDMEQLGIAVQKFLDEEKVKFEVPKTPHKTLEVRFFIPTQIKISDLRDAQAEDDDYKSPTEKQIEREGVEDHYGNQ